MSEIKSKTFHLYSERGTWLGQVVITSDGLYSSVTDYGNFGFAWRSTGKEDFRKFLNEFS